MKLFALPDVACLHWNSVNWSQILPVIPVYIAFTVSAMMEALSDHAALSVIIGKDLYRNPGLCRIFVGEGLANLVGSIFGGLGTCSYGEGVACVGFSKVSSTLVTGTAAFMMILLAYIQPIQVFIQSIPSCVFGGCSIILYSYIAISGIKMLKEVDFNDQKNLLLVAIPLSTGVSGIALGGSVFAISGTALALICGIIVNLILRDEEN